MSQQQPCLPVTRRRKYPDDEIPNDHVGPSAEIRISTLSQSMDALQYLAMVHEEAERLPSVFVSPQQPTLHNRIKVEEGFVPIDGSAAATEYLLSHRMELIRPPTRAHLPCYSSNLLETDQNQQIVAVDKWIHTTMADFSTLREYISQCRDAGLGSQQQQSRLPVPASKDRSGWHVFCLGRDEAMGNVGGYFDHHEDDEENSEGGDEDDDSEENTGDDILGFNKSEDKEVEPQQTLWDIQTVPPNGHSPKTSLLCQFDQVLTRRVLSHHVHYLCEGWVMTRSRGLWMYALLSRLDKPLHRDDQSLLRKLLRELCRLRAQVILPEAAKGPSLATEETVLSIMNVLITIIGFYFEQSGVADGIMKICKT